MAVEATELDDVKFNSGNVKPRSSAMPCGEALLTIKKYEKDVYSGKNRVTYTFDIDADHYTKDTIWVTSEAGWRVEQFLAAFCGDVSVGMKQFLTDEFQTKLVGRTGKVDLGRKKYQNTKNGRIGYINTIENYVSDKNPSLKLDPTLDFTVDDTVRAKKAPKEASTFDAAGASAEDEEDGEIPF